MAETVETLKAKAVAATGLRDFGGDWFEQPLAAWVEDLAGPSLSESGRAFLARLAVTNLSGRLEVVDWFNRHPEIDDVAMPPILYITGLERSGTTLLHNLLALHPKSRALLRWELMRPAPPPEANAYRTDPRIAEVQASIDRLRGGLLEHMHWVNADEPEECTWAALDCTGLLGRSAVMLMPTWRRWLEDNDLTPSFQEYRRLIKLLIWRNPPPQGGHLVLKCPQNSRNVGQFSEAFPEAQFILTHRDPFRTSTSACALVSHITAPLSAREDVWRPDGSAVKDVVRLAERGMTQMTAFDHAASGRVAHVAYPELVRDPTPAVESVYERLSVEAPKDLASRVGGCRAASAGKRAAPPNELPTFGLDHDAFLARPLVKSYCMRFGVEPEAARLTGV
jgi:Sulfotransferase family